MCGFKYFYIFSRSDGLFADISEKNLFFLEHTVPPPLNIKKDRKPPQGEVVKKINIISVGFCPRGAKILPVN